MRTSIACLLVVAACGGSPGAADDVPDLDGGVDAAPWHPNGMVVLYQGAEHPNGVAVDDSTVYWVSARTSDSASIRARVLDTSVEREVVSEVQRATILVQDSTYLYYAEEPGHIMRVPKAGGAREPIVTVTADQSWFALDIAYVYFTSAGDVWRAPKVGGAPVRLGATPADTFYTAVDDTNVYLLTTAGLYKMPKAGGTATLMTTENAGAEGNILVHGNFVYFSDRLHDRVVRVPKDGPQGAFEAIAMMDEPGRLAADASALFWVHRPRTVTGAVYRLDNGSTVPQSIAMPEYPADVQVTPTAIFWTDYGRANGGAVIAIPR